MNRSRERDIRAAAAVAATGAVVLSLTACGRGPVEPLAGIPGNTITIELFVQGQITPSQGDYLIVVNANTNSGNVNSLAGEQPGEPTIIEAYGSNPAPFTHWDQVFVFGNNPHGLPQCPYAPPPPTGYSYCYKAIRTAGGQNSISFVPIFLSRNSYRLVPNANSGTGTNNALTLTMPISCFSVRASTSASCDTVSPVDVTNLYVNLVTLDTTGAPADQLACLAAQTYQINLTVSNTYQLIKPANCTNPPPPSNDNLLITGGLVIVNLAH